MNDDRGTSNIDRTGDHGERWRGKVINVMDPKKQGRVQVRVVGLHDNETLIPDKDLPWALPRVPINAGASYRGVSGSPVGVIPGSIVDGYFADRQRTILIVTGTLQAAGRTKSGETVDGSYALDPAYNDVTNSARGTDLNAAIGLRNLPAISQIGSAFPNVSAGVGHLPTRTGNILSILKQVDPNNMSGVMTSGVAGFISSSMVSQLASLTSSLGSASSIASKLGQLQSLASPAALSQLTSLASSYTGGAAALSSALTQVQRGALPITSLPPQLQSLASSFPGGISQLAAAASSFSGLPSQLQSLASVGGISSLISIAKSIAGNPTSLLKYGIGGLMNQALGIASSLGSAVSTLNGAISWLSTTSQQRDFSLQAATPAPPSQPDIPTSTSSNPGSAGSRKDPYASLPSVELPKPVTSSDFLDSMIDKPQENAQVTSGDVLKIGPVPEAPAPVTNQEVLQTDTALENQSIFNQIEQQNLENNIARDQQQQQSIQTALQFGIGA